jgi:hypothetical protein
MIHNKSSHPVEVKKISIRLWALRDEIEAALDRRMKECEATGVPLYIEDIKRFYNLNSVESTDNVIPLKGLEKEAEQVVEKSDEKKEEDEEKKDEQPSEEVLSPENKSLGQAEEIIAEQTLQGLDTKKLNPIIDRPYQRQAPDLDKISYGFVLLSDINMENMLCFTKEKFTQGQSVIIEYLVPKTFILTANITYCHYYAMRSRIISSTRPDYRVQSKFSFSLPRERDNLRNFLISIEPHLAGDKKKTQKEGTDDSLEV